jgi:membrane associated rhomboid family serine protease
MKRIFTGPPRIANLILLILASQKIRARKSKGPRGIDILIASDQADEAISQVAAYFRENPSVSTPVSTSAAMPAGFLSATVFTIMGLLAAVHFGIEMTGVRWDFILAYGVSGMYLFQGDTFRAVTALFLHSDTVHLLGNLAGLFFFAGPLIRLSGYGSGPLFLLFAGTSGNLINAGFRGTALLSIGASTAVMGAAGGLAAYQMMRQGPLRRRDRILPLVAGATLMAFLSHGENTDVWAHVFGFCCGLAGGVLFFPLLEIWRFRLREPVALAITLGIVISAVTAARTS